MSTEDAMDHLAPSQGSFGSAGSSRSLRQTNTRAGTGHTATIMGLKPYQHDVLLDDPSIEDLWRSINSQQCCFCDDPRTFKALSQHWVFAHGIDLQAIRDRLQVPKGYSFISPELSSTFVARGKRLYNPHKLRNNGAPKVMSEYGASVNRAKLAAIPVVERKSQRARAVAAAIAQRVAITEQYKQDHPCIICGTVFDRVTYHATTCSKECNDQRRRLKADRSLHPERQIEKICRSCGITFKRPRGVTCSIQCRDANNSANAQNRPDHQALMRRRHQEELAKRPQRYCSISGCSKPYLAKELCSAHYQQDRLSINAANAEGRE